MLLLLSTLDLRSGTLESKARYRNRECLVDPVTLIVAALIAGAIKGADGVAEQGTKDAYAGLKSLVKKCFGSRPAADMVLDEHAKDPDTYQIPLEKHLLESGAAQDAAVLEAARKLLAMTDPEGTRAGIYNVQNTGSVTATHNSVAAVNITGGVSMGQPQAYGGLPDPS